MLTDEDKNLSLNNTLLNKDNSSIKFKNCTDNQTLIFSHHNLPHHTKTLKLNLQPRLNPSNNTQFNCIDLNSPGNKQALNSVIHGRRRIEVDDKNLDAQKLVGTHKLPDVQTKVQLPSRKTQDKLPLAKTQSEQPQNISPEPTTASKPTSLTGNIYQNQTNIQNVNINLIGTINSNHINTFTSFGSNLVGQNLHFDSPQIGKSQITENKILKSTANTKTTTTKTSKPSNNLKLIKSYSCDYNFIKPSNKSSTSSGGNCVKDNQAINQEKEKIDQDLHVDKQIKKFKSKLDENIRPGVKEQKLDKVTHLDHQNKQDQRKQGNQLKIIDTLELDLQADKIQDFLEIGVKSNKTKEENNTPEKSIKNKNKKVEHIKRKEREVEKSNNICNTKTNIYSTSEKKKMYPTEIKKRSMSSSHHYNCNRLENKPSKSLINRHSLESSRSRTLSSNIGVGGERVLDTKIHVA